MRAKLEQSLDKVVLTSPAGIAWFREALHGEQIEVIRRKGRSWAVISEQIGLGWSRFTLSEIHFVNSQPKIEATPMKDQMQYIVIEGRKPQDNSKPTQALLILPKWISPTLACAGIVGRVIELTDGNIIEQGAVPMDEQGVLEALREDMQLDAESQQEPVVDFTPSRAEAMEPIEVPAVRPTPGAADVAQQRDDAYREGMQATRDKLAGLLLQFGMPAGAKVPNWLKEQLEELAQFRKDRPETLARLQAAEDNLDAWRDAAGAADLVQVCDVQTGRIKQLLVQGAAVEQLASRDAADDVRIFQETIDGLETANEHMREELRNMHAQLLERPTVMNFAGPVTIVQGNPPSVFGPDLSKSAE